MRPPSSSIWMRSVRLDGSVGSISTARCALLRARSSATCGFPRAPDTMTDLTSSAAVLATITRYSALSGSSRAACSAAAVRTVMGRLRSCAMAAWRPAIRRTPPKRTTAIESTASTPPSTRAHATDSTSRRTAEGDASAPRTARNVIDPGTELGANVAATRNAAHAAHSPTKVPSAPAPRLRSCAMTRPERKATIA